MLAPSLPRRKEDGNDGRDTNHDANPNGKNDCGLHDTPNARKAPHEPPRSSDANLDGQRDRGPHDTPNGQRDQWTRQTTSPTAAIDC